MHYRVVGLDRETGEDRVVEIEAESSDACFKIAYDRGIVVEKAHVIRPKKAALTTEKKQEFRLHLPFLGQRGNYEARGVNTVGEIAAGVFVGLLLFSCVSPLVFFVVISVYGAWILSFGQQ